MARRASDQPTETELEILQLLWELGPSPLNDVCVGLRRQREVATTTVATMLKVMEDKGLVQRDRKGRGALWSARRDERDTAKGLVSRFVERTFGGSPRKLVAHLLEDGELSDGDRAAILEMLREHEGDDDGGAS